MRWRETMQEFCYLDGTKLKMAEAKEDSEKNFPSNKSYFSSKMNLVLRRIFRNICSNVALWM